MSKSLILYTWWKLGGRVFLNFGMVTSRAGILIDHEFNEINEFLFLSSKFAGVGD